MTDVFSRRKRSAIMRSIRGKGNRSTEGRIRYRLARAGFSGWLLHDENVTGKPDFSFPKVKVAVFVDGCFWHGCRSCRNLPTTRREFWKKKIATNRQRDKIVLRRLRQLGWRTVRFWEHEIRSSPSSCLKKIGSLVNGDDSAAKLALGSTDGRMLFESMIEGADDH